MKKIIFLSKIIREIPPAEVSLVEVDDAGTSQFVEKERLSCSFLFKARKVSLKEEGWSRSLRKR